MSARDRELIVEYSCADTDLTERLQLEPESGKPRLFYFTLNELNDLQGYVAAEANNAGKNAVEEWDGLCERINATSDGYTFDGDKGRG